MMVRLKGWMNGWQEEGLSMVIINGVIQNSQLEVHCIYKQVRYEGFSP